MRIKDVSFIDFNLITAGSPIKPSVQSEGFIVTSEVRAWGMCAGSRTPERCSVTRWNREAVARLDSLAKNVVLADFLKNRPLR